MPLRPFLSRSLRYYSTPRPQSIADLISNPSYKHQIWLSRSNDPFLNLSIEHYILQKSHKDSTVLFLYVNSPCVVIGRNQNPWLEADLRVVGRSTKSGIDDKEGIVQLVRRRSGGGTVFHDEQNVNYSVICPTADFKRDKHAEMVARAMRKFNPRARVNERHDIVLDQGDLRAKNLRPHPEDVHQTAYSSEEIPPRKVSGSAFKLTKHRSLHHGTCLLASHLDSVRNSLRSEARPFLKARGVDSIRSPVGNLLSSNASAGRDVFVTEVITQFRSLYGLSSEGADRMIRLSQFAGLGEYYVYGNHVLGSVGDEILPELQNGFDEIKSRDWTYCQTPQFILSSHPVEEDNRERPPLPEGWPPAARVYLRVRSGVITSSRISVSGDCETASKEEEHFHHILENRTIHDITDFREILKLSSGLEGCIKENIVASWLNHMFGKLEG